MAALPVREQSTKAFATFAARYRFEQSRNCYSKDGTMYKTSLIALTVICLAACASAGCRSFSSTPITRDVSGVESGDSNGNRGRFAGGARLYKGTPVKLRVQTHSDVFIEEEYQVRAASVVTPRADLQKRYYSVRTEPVIGEKIVFVDFKRPAGGLLDMDFEYSEAQYFKAINSKIDDDTIEDTAGFAKKLAELVTPTSEDSESQEDRGGTDIEDVKRIVAYKRFDINDCDYEQQVQQFVNQYLNDCDGCGQQPIYDKGAVSNGLAYEH